MSSLNDAVPTFSYRVIGAEGLDAILPLWEKLRAHHAPLLSKFSGDAPPFNFEPRKQEILGKAAAGKIRVELVTSIPGVVDIAYCVSTVSEGGRGEIGSMFVEERFRCHGIGSQLVRHALAWMDATGASSRVVTVAHANEAALAFYERFGFQPRTILLQHSIVPNLLNG
jgi:diamine N-acetyltransferase